MSFVALSVLCIGSVYKINSAAAQGWTDPGAPSEAIPKTTPQAAAIDPLATSGPTIYVVDKYRRLATINLGTKAVHVIGYTGPTLTDIGFNPKNHKLYGITFTDFYEVNTTNAATTHIGSLGVNDANSLVFNSYGTAYSAGVNTGYLYSINTTSGRASYVGSTGGYASAGDLSFYNGGLYLSGFKGSGNIGPTTKNYLLRLSERTGHDVGTPILLPVYEMFGLVSTGTNLLYGLALTGSHAGLYKITPSETVESKRATLLKDLYPTLGQVLGAAYNGNYQP